ncbi:general secretion pathway protein GspK [bacterium]|nr:general secretion pathway protein GspK [bacterium]
MKKQVKNKGIALIIVLSAITLLTTIGVEFAFNTNVYYRLANNAKNRLQAEYLAKSSLNLMKLELKLDKQIRSAVSNLNISQYLGGEGMGPICQQFPFSTALLKAMFMGESFFDEAETESDEKKEPAEDTETDRVISAFETSQAEEFLNFDGDFDGECQIEDSKWNLSYFYDLDPTKAVPEGSINEYDSYKQLLIKYLSQEKFKKLFEEKSEKINEVVRNIADWVDKNERINELGGVEVGSEDSIYGGRTQNYYVKNGKFLTLDELYLVEGVKDDWFTTLKDSFTIYGDGKVNVCTANDGVITALILRYGELNTKAPPIDPKNTKLLDNLLTAVKMGCQGVTPNVNTIAANLDNALGIGTATATTGTDQQAAQNTAQQGASTTTSSQFADMITTDNRYYTLILTGTVNDSVVRIKTVLDVEKDNPKDWKMLYWRMY